MSATEQAQKNSEQNSMSWICHHIRAMLFWLKILSKHFSTQFKKSSDPRPASSGRAHFVIKFSTAFRGIVLQSLVGGDVLLASRSCCRQLSAPLGLVLVCTEVYREVETKRDARPRVSFCICSSACGSSCFCVLSDHTTPQSDNHDRLPRSISAICHYNII